jgi:hypothetical protein
MALPPGNALRSSLLALPWLPSCGLLLAVSGTLVFLVGMTEPLRTLEPPLGMARLETGQDPARATAGLVRITAVDRTATNHRSRQVTTQDRILRGDPRDALMAVAAGHDVRSEMRSCRLLMMGLACPGRSQANSDDRIANALFAPTESRDARWDLIEMAGVQGGAWTRQCPCPVYIDYPVGSPR